MWTIFFFFELDTDHEWLFQQMKQNYDTKKELVGVNHLHEVVFLGRFLRLTPHGLEWEANVKHALTLLTDFRMSRASSIGTPVTMEMVSGTTEPGVPLPGRAAKDFRAGVARLNYLAQDRPDLGLAACVLSMKMANPTKDDLPSLKRVLRYLRGRRRVAMLYQW